MANPAFVATNGGAGASGPVTVTALAGTAAGNLLVAFVTQTSSIASTHTGPSGWTQVGTTQTIIGTITASVWVKVATASEPSYTWTFSQTTTGWNVVIGAYSSASAIADAISFLANTTTSAGGTAITTLRPNSLVLYLLGCSGNHALATGPSGMTSRAHAGGTISTDLYDEVQATAGTTGALAGAYGAAQNSGVFLVAFPPPPLDTPLFFGSP